MNEVTRQETHEATRQRAREAMQQTNNKIRGKGKKHKKKKI
jgi:hypothetical protein